MTYSHIWTRRQFLLLTPIISALLLLILACGGETVVVETVIVEKQVPGDTVVETVIVEKQVPGDTVVETVIVEKQVPGDTVVETVIVEKQVPGEKIIQTVIVEKQVPVTVVPTATIPGQAPPTPEGSIIIAVDNAYFMNSYPQYCPACSVTARTGTIETLLEAVRAPDGTVGLGPLLATSWTMSTDGISYMDLKIRKGVEFHRGWGTMTAVDVAWTWNNSNLNLYPEAVHDTGSAIAAVLKDVEVIDEETVRFNWSAFAGHIPLQLLTNYSEGIGILSKKFHDTVGPDRMKEELIGTGPYEMIEWEQHKGAFVSALNTHWRKVPDVKRITFMEVPEPSVRKAMLLAGQAQISQVETSEWPALLEMGYSQAPEGLKQNVSPMFVGNYWADVNMKTGQTLDSTDPADSATYKPVRDTSKAWIGDPDDPDSMERSRKVRLALAMTIDREAMVGIFAPGFGWVEYVPGWDVNHPLYKDEWTVPYDPDRARELLVEAGYPDGFDLEYWASGVSFATGEEAEVIGTMWLQELNVNTTYIKTVYSAHRPTLVNRTATALFNWQGPTGPKTWPLGRGLSTLSRPGLSQGLEIPLFGEISELMAVESDPQKLIDQLLTFWDYNNDNMLWTGVFGKPAAALYDPAVIESWRMLPEGRGLMGRVNSIEYIKLRP